MAFLFEQIETLKDLAPDEWRELPREVAENLCASRPLRDYQVAALRNFATYFENERFRRKPAQTLFHMATGSGKTLVMAALVLYLYRQGHRNFLFFVNLDNIVKKTEANFLDPGSPKYLFAPAIRMGGETVRVRHVENFQGADPDAVNLCFKTVQGLHHDMWFHKEGAPTFEDFAETPVVLLSDEALTGMLAAIRGHYETHQFREPGEALPPLARNGRLGDLLERARSVRGAYDEARAIARRAGVPFD